MRLVDRTSMSPAGVADLAGYIVTAYAVTWTLLAPLVLWSLGAIHVEPPAVLHVLGAIGPTVGALVVARRRQGWAGVAKMWRRIWDPASDPSELNATGLRPDGLATVSTA